jgi:cytochrome P450
MRSGEAGLPAGPQLSPADITFQWWARPFALLDECAAEFGDAFTLRYTRFGTHVIVSHPEDVRRVFTGDPAVLRAGRGNALLAPILGDNSLLLVDGERHLAQRAALQPVFRPDRLGAYVGIVARATARHTAGWEGGRRIRVQPTALAISKEVILQIVAGVERDHRDELSRLIDHLMVPVGTNAPLDDATASPVMARFTAARRALESALQALIDRRRADDTPRDDVLGALLASRDPEGRALEDAAIRDQLITMLLAGHETTASAITWALVCLNDAPAAHGRLVAELDGIGPDAPPERLAGLPYLQAVCLETLRLWPVIPVVARELHAPFHLRNRTLPAGVFVTPCAYLAHRRPDAFPEPTAFRPERFLDRRFPAHVYFPFGGGVRRCIGMAFALLEMQIVLATLVRRFRFAPAGAVHPVRRAVTVVASGGGAMHVERRARA